MNDPCGRFKLKNKLQQLTSTKIVSYYIQGILLLKVLITNAVNAISRKHFCFCCSLFVKWIIAIEAYLYFLGLAGQIKYIKVTCYMYASAFLTTICAGSNPQSL